MSTTMDVFTIFDTSPYTFLKIKQGVEGNTIETEYDAEGVFKFRGGMTGRDIETPTADATIHVRPSETFVTDLEGDLVGHGIAAGGETYRIVGQSAGMDYDEGLKFYRLTLKREQIAWELASPLE